MPKHHKVPDAMQQANEHVIPTLHQSCWWHMCIPHIRYESIAITAMLIILVRKRSHWLLHDPCSNHDKHYSIAVCTSSVANRYPQLLAGLLPCSDFEKPWMDAALDGCLWWAHPPDYYHILAYLAHTGTKDALGRICCIGEVIHKAHSAPKLIHICKTMQGVYCPTHWPPWYCDIHIVSGQAAGTICIQDSYAHGPADWKYNPQLPNQLDKWV